MAAHQTTARKRQLGLLTNPFLLLGIAFEFVCAAALIYLPAFQSILGTARRRLFDQAIMLSFRSSPR
jgi:hypothetical protein